MWINHKLVDFSNAAKMNGVQPGCVGANGEDEDEDEEADEANKNAGVDDNMQVDSAVDQILVQQPSQHVAHPAHSGMFNPSILVFKSDQFVNFVQTLKLSSILLKIFYCVKILK